MRFVGFIGPSYTQRSVNVDCQRSVGLYPEIDELGTGKEKEVGALIGTPGLRLLVTLPAGPVRGTFTASNGQAFAVGYNKLYQLSSTFAATEIGTLNTFSGRVSMADNGIDLCLVDGFYGYFWQFTSSPEVPGVFTPITDPNFPGAGQVCYQDGYFVFNKPGSGTFFISGLNDTTFDGLVDTASAEGSPDNLIALLSSHEDIWLFGTRSVEVWFNAGGTTTDADGNLLALFPFQRVQGAFVEVGCAAANSVAKMNNTVFWLGQDERGAGIVYQAQGYQPQRISTHPVEFAIQGYQNISDAVSYCYQENGHNFYVLNFPSANTTWVYDSTTSLWHERVYTRDGAFERHRADNHAFAFGKHIVGDYANGNIYEMSSAYLDDAGQPITRMRTAPHITSDLALIAHTMFQLDIESGTGIDGAGQGVDPQAMLQFSDDGGHSWSNEQWVSMGRIGNTKARAMWRRLGTTRDRVYRVKITDPVKVVLIGAEIGIQQRRA